MEDLKLKQFNAKLKKDFSMLIYGSRRSGKSTLLKYMYELNKLGERYDHVICFSENTDALDDMKTFVHGNLFFDKFDSAVLHRAIILSKKYEDIDKPKKFLILCDDTGSLCRNDENIQKIFIYGRHMGMSIIILSQHYSFLSADSRNNADYLIIGRSNSGLEKKAMIDNFLIGSRETDLIKDSEYGFYRKLLNKYTENYKFLVIDCTSNNNSFHSVVKYIRAEY